MLQALASPHNRRVTIPLLVVSVVGIVAGYALSGAGHSAGNPIYLASLGLLVLAFAHPWRRVREFKHLFYASGLGFAVFVLLHNLLDLGQDALSGGVLYQVVRAGSIGSFVVAVFVCPPLMVYSLVGIVVMFFWTRLARA